jgi:hypothetical protein
MRVLIIPQHKHITIDDVALRVDAMPSDLDFPPEKRQSGPRRPLLQVDWNAGVLTVVRHSRAAGRQEVEYFGSDGLGRIQGFTNAYYVEKTRLDEERREQAEEAERQTAESARINAARETQSGRHRGIKSCRRVRGAISMIQTVRGRLGGTTLRIRKTQRTRARPAHLQQATRPRQTIRA